MSCGLGRPTGSRYAKTETGNSSPNSSEVIPTTSASTTMATTTSASTTKATTITTTTSTTTATTTTTTPSARGRHFAWINAASRLCRPVHATSSQRDPSTNSSERSGYGSTCSRAISTCVPTCCMEAANNKLAAGHIAPGKAIVNSTVTASRGPDAFRRAVRHRA